jgi:hypothetical protein
MAQPPHTGGKRGIVPDFWTAGITRRLRVHDPLGHVAEQHGHCQLNEKSLTEAFLVRKADSVQVAKIEAIVKEENER